MPKTHFHDHRCADGGVVTVEYTYREVDGVPDIEIVSSWNSATGLDVGLSDEGLNAILSHIALTHEFG